MKKVNLDNLPEASKPNKQITIVFDENSTHQEVIRQFVDKLFTHDFAPRKEIIENLLIADILLEVDKKPVTKFSPPIGKL